MSPRIACLFLIGLSGLVAHSARAQPLRQLPGPREDGSTLLPNGWSIAPHGRQIALPSDLPVRMAFHPSAPILAIQHAGYGKHLVVLVHTGKDEIVATCELPQSWSGMAWTADGERLLVSGGADDVVHVLAFDAGNRTLTASSTIEVGSSDRLDVPAGLCCTADGRLFVALNRGHAIARVSADGKDKALFSLPADSYPYECILSRDEKTLYVSLWNGSRVVALDPSTGETRLTVETGSHPGELLLSPDGERLFVSNANDNTVTVIDLERGEASETLSSSLFPLAPPGSTPNSIALTPDGRRLFIANADNANCAVLDVSRKGRSRGLGFVPLGWYPTSIRVSPDGKRVYAANGKGSGGSAANPEGPRPGGSTPTTLDQYIGSMFRGSLSVFAVPERGELARTSEAAYACSPLEAAAKVRESGDRPEGSPIPARVGDPSPITHCVYIIKENRTYDQVLGDDPRGNGDENLCLFPEKVTPNHHALACEFVLLDNFYVESEVSADGHEWSMGAYATDFVERTWPVTYGGRGKGKLASGKTVGLAYPSEGAFLVAYPEGGYLWDLARAAGISYRSFGEFVINAPTTDEPATTKVEALQGHFDPYYRSYDLDYRDVDRAKRFLVELARFEKEGEMPRLVVISLPNDHTSGARAGKPTPRAYVADNDLALGMVVEGLSRSRFWKSLAIFVVEDDAQNGPDHVDAHRTVAFVLGPWVRRNAVVSELYSTCGMLRTMELILGLPPMSQFDAAARPLYACFATTPDETPYLCREPGWPTDERNEKTGRNARLSERLELAREDAADDILLNRIIWESVKGEGSPMPMPRRAAFVRVFEEDEEDS